MKNTKAKSKTLKQLYSQLQIESPMFVSLFTRVSVRPQIKLCDLTGLEARYVCPRTGLQYHSIEVYEKIREMPTETAQIFGNVRTLGRNISPFNKK